MMRRLAPVLFVFLLAPVTAEYLIGYDDTLTNPAALIFGIVVFGPLYGAPAVLIREVTRRREPWLGWFGLGVVSALWLLAGWLILQDQLATSSSRISTGQLVGTLALVFLLVIAALTRRRKPPLRSGTVPAPWLVGLVSAGL